MSERICFVIAPIGDPESETRKRSDQVLKHVIGPAAALCGYKALRADQISEPGMITSQVIQHIVEDPLVVADLTDRNPNVFYELAIRHAIRKPLVQLIKKGEQVPFDVAGTRTIHVDHHDLDSVEAAKQDIISQIHALEKDPTRLETPISVSLDLQALRQSDDPEQRTLADVLSALSELRSSVLSVEIGIAALRTQGATQPYQVNLSELLPKSYWQVEKPQPSALDEFYRQMLSTAQPKTDATWIEDKPSTSTAPTGIKGEPNDPKVPKP
jgi:hypothetical protein